jgi:hypothetical protein
MVMIIIQAYGALVVLLLMFATISGICDKHLIPCVEVFIKRYKIPEEVAGYFKFHVLNNYKSFW